MAQVHASCVLLARAGEAFGAPADAGVLLLGESGSGKSDLALRLIERGAVLVSDDRTELFAEAGALIAAPAKGLVGLIEVRNLGILELPHADTARVHLAVHLSDNRAARLPEADRRRDDGQRDAVLFGGAGAAGREGGGDVRQPVCRTPR